jgi:hypothetical protein
MKDIIDVDPEKMTVTYEDNTTVSFNEFEKKFKEHMKGRIAGETLTHSDLERFMKRGSAKNLKQFGDARKAEGYLEATIGKKMSPELVKLLIMIAIIAVIGIVAYFIITKMHLI